MLYLEVFMCVFFFVVMPSEPYSQLFVVMELCFLPIYLIMKNRNKTPKAWNWHRGIAAFAIVFLLYLFGALWLFESNIVEMNAGDLYEGQPLPYRCRVTIPLGLIDYLHVVVLGVAAVGLSYVKPKYRDETVLTIERAVYVICTLYLFIAGNDAVKWWEGYTAPY